MIDDDEGDDGDGRDAGQPAVTDVVLEHVGSRADVEAAGDDLRDAERHRQRAQGDDERWHLGLGHEEPVEDAPAEADDDREHEADEGGGPALAAHRLHRLGGDDGGDDEDRADRQVDAGGDDDERHPDGEHRPDRHVLRDVGDVAGREERGRRQRAEDGDDDDEHPEDPDRLHRLDALEEAVVAGGGLDGLRRGRGGGHAAPSFLSRAPVMAPTSSSTEVSAARYVATRRPRRSTCTRSATSSTCGMECEMRTTARPAVAHLLDRLEDVLASARRRGRRWARRGRAPCWPRPPTARWRPTASDHRTSLRPARRPSGPPTRAR